MKTTLPLYGNIGIAVFWLCLFATVVAKQVYGYELPGKGVLSHVEPFILLSAIGCWLQADITARGIELKYPGALGVGVVLLAPVIVPIYIVVTRGAKEALFWFGRVAACLAGTTAVAAVVWVADKHA